MPCLTRACRTGSRCRGGRLWRVARALAATGRPRALSAMSITAVIARMLLRGRSGMGISAVDGKKVAYGFEILTPKGYQLFPPRVPVGPKPPTPRLVSAQFAVSQIGACNVDAR